MTETHQTNILGKQQAGRLLPAARPVLDRMAILLRKLLGQDGIGAVFAVGALSDTLLARRNPRADLCVAAAEPGAEAGGAARLGIGAGKGELGGALVVGHGLGLAKIFIHGAPIESRRCAG